MKIAIYGSGGTLGQRIIKEAQSRGHQVTAVARDPAKLKDVDKSVKVVKGDVTDVASVAAAVVGHDAVINSVGPNSNTAPTVYVEAAHALLTGLKQADVKRLIVVGGAGGLEVAPGVLLKDLPNFPAFIVPISTAHLEALKIYQTSDLDWTWVSPAAMIEPGERTGTYRVGNVKMLVDAKGESRISTEDYAVALIDELENPKHIRQRMTVAY